MSALFVALKTIYFIWSRYYRWNFRARLVFFWNISDRKLLIFFNSNASCTFIFSEKVNLLFRKEFWMIEIHTEIHWIKCNENVWKIHVTFSKTYKELIKVRIYCAGSSFFTHYISFKILDIPQGNGFILLKITVLDFFYGCLKVYTWDVLKINFIL